MIFRKMSLLDDDEDSSLQHELFGGGGGATDDDNEKDVADRQLDENKHSRLRVDNDFMIDQLLMLLFDCNYRHL